MKCIIQKQCHSTVINTVNKDTELWVPADGMITYDKDLVLIVYGADCSIIAFWNEEKIGVCHAGWRGLTDGIIDRMVKEFEGGECQIGPLIHSFEIQPDDCYEKIYSAYGDKYFSVKNSKIIFDFKRSVLDRVAPISSTFDERDTFKSSNLASWRGKRSKGDGTQNRMTIWRDLNNKVHVKFFYPGEKIRKYFDCLSGDTTEH